ncbi:MAG: PilZ domain-containing protein [Anaerolineales bacterium]
MRAYIRHHVNVPVEIFFHRKESHFIRHIDNVSLGGFSFISDTPLKKGMHIKLKMNILKPTFETLGQVIWCKKEGNDFRIGIQFMERNDVPRMLMLDQLCYVEKYKQEVSQREGRLPNREEALYDWLRQHAPQLSTQDHSSHISS